MWGDSYFNEFGPSLSLFMYMGTENEMETDKMENASNASPTKKNLLGKIYIYWT